MTTATIIGSGPNGLSAAIVLAAAGIDIKFLEPNSRIGGACSTAETTLPGFRQDLGSSAYPMAFASPFFRSLPVSIPWIVPPAQCAHPLDDGTAVLLELSIEDTVATLDSCVRWAYRSLLKPLTGQFDQLIDEVLSPMWHFPRHPLLLARFGPLALLSGMRLAKSFFRGQRAPAFFASMTTHSILPLEQPTSAAVALVLMAAGHARGWPILRGGPKPCLTSSLAISKV